MGFTLIEMLVAIAIGVVISIMAYSSLSGAIKANERVRQVTQEIDEVDRAWQYLGNDLLFAVPRQWVNNLGQSQPALMGVDGDRLSQSEAIIAGEEDYLLQFVRGNRGNLLNLRRSNLYIVGFRLTQDEDSGRKSLWRDSWAPVDGAADQPEVQQRLLLTDIEEMRLEYLPENFQDYNQQAWLTGWPSQNSASKTLLPVAIKISIQSASLGAVERVFMLSVAK